MLIHSPWSLAYGALHQLILVLCFLLNVNILPTQILSDSQYCIGAEGVSNSFEVKCHHLNTEIRIVSLIQSVMI